MSARKPAVLFILITVLIDSISFGIIIPVFQELIMKLEGCSISEAAVIGAGLVTVFAVAQFIFSPILGALSDKYGRRPILLTSLFGFGLDFILLALAPTVGWLFAGRIIAGIMGASYTTAAAYIADISTDENKVKNYGLLGAAFGMGFIIGPGVGALVAQFGVRVPFIVCAVLSLCNWLYGYFVLPESLKPENRRAFEWKRANPIGAFLHMGRYKTIYGLLAAFFLLYTAAQAVMTNWQYYTVYKFQWNSTNIGISITIVGVLVALVQGGLVRIVNPRIGNTNAVIAGLVLYVIGMLAFGLAPTGLFMYLACIPYCLGGINGPAMQTIMSDSVPKDSQGELQGLITSTQSLTSIFGPLMMAGIFYHFTEVSSYKFPGAAFISGAILIFLALIIAYFTLEHRLRGKREENVMDRLEPEKLEQGA